MQNAIRQTTFWLRDLRHRLFTPHCVACRQPIPGWGKCRRPVCFFTRRHGE